jgi:hypothetical protein
MGCRLNIIADTCIGGVAEAAQTAEKFRCEGRINKFAHAIGFVAHAIILNFWK